MKNFNKYLFTILLTISFVTIMYPQNSRGLLTPYPGEPIFVKSSQNINQMKMQGDAIDFNTPMILGADYLKHMQADITEDNAGNGSGGTETPDDPDDGGWDWSVTSPPAPFFHKTTASATNLYGVCALGLYYAYLETNDATYFTAMTDAADKAVLAGTGDIRTAADMQFLMLYNDLPGVVGTSYMEAAKAKYDWRITNQGGGTATGFAVYLRDTRGVTQGYPNGIIAWDLGAYAVVAQMLYAQFGGTYNNDAIDIAEVLWQDSFSDNPGLFDVVDDAGWDPTYTDKNFWWYTLGISGLIDAFRSSGVHTDEVPWLVGQIQNSQYANSGAISGSYGAHTDDEDWQSTAYCVKSLNDVNPTTYKTEINHAAYFIASTQDASGGWLYSDFSHYPEIGGENTTALYFGNAPLEVWVDDDFTSTSSGGHLWGYNAFSTIQEGIEACADGGQVNVAAGTYSEGQIVIDKSLTIQGQGKDVTVINSNYNTANGGHDNDASAWIRTEPGTMVYLSDMTLDATGFDTHTALRFKSSGMVSNVHLNQIKHSAGPYFGIGIQVQDGNVDVTNCVFTEIGRIGVHYRMGVITGASVSGTYDGNTYTGKGDGDWLDYALDISGATTVTVTNSTITSNTGVASDGSTSAGILATTYFPAGQNLPNNVTILYSELTGNTDGIAVGFDASDVSVVVANNNNIYGNITYGVNSTAPTVDAEYNWWGTAIESEIQALINGPVDYDPWIGKAETVPVSQTTPTVYDFPIAGVKMIFSTLPVGGGNVTVQRYNEAPTPFPSGYTNVGMWLDITSTMPNYSFDVTVYVDVFGIPGFDATTTVMYYNSSTSSWMAIPGGTYLASDPMFGGHPSFSFVTNHFTPFTFINTPATAYDVYLSSSTSAASGFIFPNDNWGTTAYEPPYVDWDFTTPIDFYIVPEVGSVFGASDINIQWDNTMFTYFGVDKTGGIYDNASSQLFTNQVGNQLTINASRTDNANFTIGTNDYIAKLTLNLLKPGFGPVSFTGLDFRAFDGVGGQLGVYVTGNNGQVKSYLGDVASSSSTSTGDGLIDFDDLTPWSISYWSGVGGFGMTYYKVKYDVGPTSDNTVYGLPTVDSKIQFEDLVIFSMSYGLSASHIYPKINAEPTEPVKLQLGDPVIAGSQTRVPLFVSGGVQNVRAMSLTFAGQFGKLVSVEKGALLTEFTNPVIVMSNTDGNQVYVDLAVFGAEETGINSEGELLTLIFEGTTELDLNSADIRNIFNKPMDVNISGTDALVPAEFALLQNYPNPFNPSTTINYELPEQAMVEISIFNALGERVVSLVNEMKDAGRHSVAFNAAGYSSGIYFYQIKANDFVSVKKMILMK